MTRRKLASVALAALAIAVARQAGWTADEPFLALLVAVLGASAVSEFVAIKLPRGGSTVQLHIRIAAQMLAITVPIYLIGWGPVLGCGYLYIFVDNFRKDGSRAETPLLVWLAVSMLAGQIAIATGLVQSLVDPAAVHGVAALVFLGLATGVEFLGSSTRARERDEAARRASEARIAALVQHSTDTIAVFAPNGRITYVSPAAESLIGESTDQIVGRHGYDFAHPDDMHLAEAVVARCYEAPGEAVQGELRLCTPSGQTRIVEFTATNLLTDEAVGGLVVNMRDVSDRKAPAQHTADQQSRDPLTGLPNRPFFETRLEGAAKRMGLSSDKAAVIVVDIDRFDRVNTTEGPATGDALLAAVAERLEACVRPDDLVARLGDDEFAILIARVLGADDVVAVAARVAADLRQPFALGGDDFGLTCSVGISLCQIGLAADDVLRQAQLAVRSVKRRGGNGYEIFDPRLAAPVRRRLDLEAQLERAVDDEQFVLHYQPVVDLRDRSVAGFEALVRWNHPRLGILPPAEFIYLAEQTGAIDVLGHWVLAQACQQAGAWQNGNGGRDMHVNLSARQVLNPDLPGWVDAALGAAKLDPERLVLEITETVLMEDVDASLAAIDRVRATGVRFAIDDFGAGYSSFAYLTRLPVQVLKLDHSLVDGLGLDMASLPIIEAIIDLAHRMGMKAIAEGVESADQLGVLEHAGCDQFQGFWFRRPLPPADAAALLAT